MEKICSKLFIALFMLTTISAFVSAQKNILFIGREATPDGYAMDRDCLDSLESWGYTVTYIANSDYASATADVYTRNDGVFMSETVNSADMVNFGIRDNYPLPIVNTEGFTPRTNRWVWLSDDVADFNQAADGAGTDIAATRAVSIKEATMPYSGKLAKNKAIASEDDFWTMITIDASATMPNKHFLWGMVGPGINGASLTQCYGTQDFFTIIKRAFEWALDQMPSNVVDHRTDDFKLIAFPNPASDRATIRFNAPGSADATVTLHNITCQQLELLFNKNTSTGNNFVFLDATKYAAGVYLISLKIGETSQYTKLIIN